MKFEDVISAMSKMDYVEVASYETLDTLYFGKVEHLSDEYDNDNVRLITAGKVEPTKYIEFQAYVIIFIDAK